MPETKSDTGTNGRDAAILFLHAQTSLHPGSGTALGVVDLPVQRERHTGWPIIPGSALKGILRDACREQAKGEYQEACDEEEKHLTPRQRANKKDPDILAAFGPAEISDNQSAFAGAISVTDARILAFPVRSLKGVFAWVTCPAVLERLNRDLHLAGRKKIDSLPAFGPAKREQAACAAGSPLLVSDGGSDKLVLEEFEFSRVAEANEVAEWIANRAKTDGLTADFIKQRVVVLQDDDFTHFVRHATEVVARIGLDYEKKTVKDGALFYQEFLPPETMFYSVVLAAESRCDKNRIPGAEVLKYLEGQINQVKFLQVGGDETIGKGLCAVRLINGKEGTR